MKDKITQKLERKFKGLANIHRIKILEFLSSGEKPVQQIEEHLKPLAQSTTTEHLLKLYNYGILERRRTSKNALYYIEDKKALEVLKIYKNFIIVNNNKSEAA